MSKDQAMKRQPITDMSTKKHTQIPMTPVKSSQIHAYGYDPESQTLAVQFIVKGKGGKNEPGAMYHYADFSPEDWKSFQSAESKYSHFHQNIKPTFKHRKIS